MAACIIDQVRSYFRFSSSRCPLNCSKWNIFSLSLLAAAHPSSVFLIDHRIKFFFFLGKRGIAKSSRCHTIRVLIKNATGSQPSVKSATSVFFFIDHRIIVLREKTVLLSAIRVQSELSFFLSSTSRPSGSPISPHCTNAHNQTCMWLTPCTRQVRPEPRLFFPALSYLSFLFYCFVSSLVQITLSIDFSREREREREREGSTVVRWSLRSANKV